MENNRFITSAESLVTTREATRAGFIEYALRKNREAIPFLDYAKALYAYLTENTESCQDIKDLPDIRTALLEAAGISDKAMTYFSDQDKMDFLENFINEVLEPCGDQYIDEIVYRYILTAGDALGGKMRNITGAIAQEKLTRGIIASLRIHNIAFQYCGADSTLFQSANDDVSNDLLALAKAIQWENARHESRVLIYNKTIPRVSKNVDIVILKRALVMISPTRLRPIMNDLGNYVVAGELKGGIDPAGADEHWKTANTALGRIRRALPSAKLCFIGAAIENAMALEIYNELTNGRLHNAANLTNDNQFNALCNWLVLI